jgi:hypothetical protein
MGGEVIKWIRVASLLLMAVATADTSSAQTTTFGGEATVLGGTIVGIPVNLAGTGPVDPSGDARNNALVCYPAGPQCYVGLPDQTAGALAVQLLNATAVARGHQSHAFASVGKLKLLIHGVLIEGGFVSSVAKAVCQPPPEGPSPESVGGVEFGQLVIGGTPVNVTGLPNQTLTVPGPLGAITIVINEQSSSIGETTVSALRIKAPTVLGVVPGSDLSVAKSHAKVNCGDIECLFPEKVTGGGFVYLETGSKGNFAAAGRHLSDWGHFLFINHDTGDKLKATMQMTTFTPDGHAEISGVAHVNGMGSLPFTARLKDNGEPGRDDLFSLMTTHPSFMISERTIAGGNIQFHKPHDSCELPPPPPPPPPPPE